jgi:hypothetical protein
MNSAPLSQISRRDVPPRSQTSLKRSPEELPHARDECSQVQADFC